MNNFEKEQILLLIDMYQNNFELGSKVRSLFGYKEIVIEYPNDYNLGEYLRKNIKQIQ